MFSRDAITAAVASSCLLLMVASQSVKACSCYEPIVETGTCLADEIWELTVESTDKHDGRGDSFGYTLYNFRIDKVIKSAMGLTDGKEGFFKIDYSPFCTFIFTANTEYFLAAESEKPELSSVQICVKDLNYITHCKHIRVLAIMKKTDAE